VWHDCGRGQLPHFYVSPPRYKLPLRHANPAPCFWGVILPGKRMRRRESGFEAAESKGRHAHAIAVAPGSLLMNARLLSCRRLVRACRGTQPCHRDDVNHRAAADSARLSHAVISSSAQAQAGDGDAKLARGERLWVERAAVSTTLAVAVLSKAVHSARRGN
jgi:hypothetical protein